MRARPGRGLQLEACDDQGRQRLALCGWGRDALPVARWGRTALWHLALANSAGGRDCGNAAELSIAAWRWCPAEVRPSLGELWEHGTLGRAALGFQNAAVSVSAPPRTMLGARDRRSAQSADQQRDRRAIVPSCPFWLPPITTGNNYTASRHLPGSPRKTPSLNTVSNVKDNVFLGKRHLPKKTLRCFVSGSPEHIDPHPPPLLPASPSHSPTKTPQYRPTSPKRNQRPPPAQARTVRLPQATPMLLPRPPPGTMQGHPRPDWPAPSPNMERAARQMHDQERAMRIGGVWTLLLGGTPRAVPSSPFELTSRDTGQHQHGDYRRCGMFPRGIADVGCSRRTASIPDKARHTHTSPLQLPEPLPHPLTLLRTSPGSSPARLALSSTRPIPRIRQPPPLPLAARN